MTLLRLAALLTVTAILALPGHRAAAEDYPSRPVKIIAPFGAGGPTDVYTRIVSQELQKALGQPFIVENRPGAGTTIGTEYVTKAAPDGYTLLMVSGTQTVNETLYTQKNYHLMTDLVPVAPLIDTDLVLVVNPSVPAKNVAELIALAKAKPGSLNYGSTGIGNPLHLTMEMLKTSAGIELQAVPYRGDAPLNAALIAGEIQVAVVPMATTLPHLQNDLLKALAVGGAQRAPALPNVATVAETIPGFESTSWQGLFVPANTPREIVTAIQRETAKALKAPDLIERLKTGGNEAVGSTPDEFDARFRADIAKFAKIVKDARIPTQD
jgi:tripartite-type tricarboxylate transporter receptor subunit TctC